MSQHDGARRRLLGSLALGSLGLALPPARAQSGALERIRARGTLAVGLYDDMPPFHDHGKGVDVALGELLAAGLGVRMQPMPFPAGEEVGDDLRNMVWKGHYLGYGPADVLLHVPVERPLMVANPQVRIFGPYFHERVVMARDLRHVPQLDSMADLHGQRCAVPGLSLAGWLLLGADSGRYARQLVTHLADGTEAARALASGEVVAAAGLASEIESVLGGDARFEITPLPLQRGPLDGWSVGMAVKSDAADLAEALQRVLDQVSEDGRLKAAFAQGRLRWPRS